MVGRKMTNWSGVLVVLSCLSACGGGDDIEAFLQLDSAKAQAFAAGGDDCNAKAVSVREWRTRHNAAYKAAQEQLKQKYPKGPPQDVMTKHGELINKNKKAVMDAMFACVNQEAFDKAIDET